MIGKNWVYNGLNMSDSQALTNWFKITNVTKDIVLRTDIFENPNDHWSKTTNTLSWPRIFSFEWECFGVTKQAREQAWYDLNNTIKPEWYFNNVRTWFYALTWEDGIWNEFTTNAKVYQAPNPVNWLCDPIIRFTFALISEDPTYTATSQNTETFVYDTLTQINYGGSFFAKPKFVINWNITNPRIENNSLWLYYQLDRSITAWTDLIVDFSDYTVTYWLTDVRADRKEGSNTVFLQPWFNTLTISGNVVSWTPSITMTYFDTFIQN